MVEREFDDWNPLVEDYHDTNTNTYTTGAGAKLPPHLQPARHGRGDSEHTLFIRPLSTRYNEESLKNMFSTYGTVTDVRIIYPKFDDKSPYGFVTYKSQSSANAAIRAFNDDDKFEFKVNFSTGSKTNDKPPRRGDRDRDRDRDQANNYRHSAEETSTPFNDYDKTDVKVNFAKSKTNERQSRHNDKSANPGRYNDFTPSQKNKSSQEYISDFNENYTDRSYENHNRHQSEKTEPFPRASSVVSTSSSTAVDKNFEEIQTHNTMIKKEPEEKPVKATRIKPMLCSFCQKLTFFDCSMCEKSFCNPECALNGWKNHTSPNCVEVAPLKARGPDSVANERESKGAPVSSNQNASSSNDVKEKAAKEEDASIYSNGSISFTNDSKPKIYASDHNSPGSELREFTNLAKDYCMNGSKSMEDAAFDKSKFNTVCDNNYDENSPKDTSFDGQAEQPAFSRTHRPFGQHNERDGETGGRGFKHGDRDGAANDHARRRFKPRDDKDGANDYERSSGGARNHGRDRNRDDRSFDDKGSSGDTDQSYGGGRNNRDGRPGFDRRTNFNDRASRKHDEVDNTGGGFDSESRPRGNRRSYNQNRNDNSASHADFDKNTSNEFTPQAHSSLVENRERDSRRQSSGPVEQKVFKLNETLQVTIVAMDQPRNTHYVRLAENEGTYESVVKKSLHAISPSPLNSISKGMKCIAKYNNEWHRAMIHSDKPIGVFLVDVGLVTGVDEQNLARIPDNLLDFRPFASKVTMPNVSRENVFKWYNENAVISIKAFSFSEDKTYIVDVISFEEQLAEVRKESDRGSQPSSVPAATPTSAPPAESIAKVVSSGPKLQSGKPAEVLVMHCPNEKEFFVSFKESAYELADLMTYKDDSTMSPLLEIREGVLACTMYEGELCRAKIVSTDPLKVNYVDYGNEGIVEAKALKVLPAKFINIPPAIRMKLFSGTVASNNVKEYESIKVTPIKMENSTTWLTLVGEKSDECASIIREMESLSLSATESKPATPKPKVAMDVSVTYPVSRSEFYGILKSDVAKLTELNTKLPELPLAAVRSIELDKTYVATFEGTLCRARLVSITPLKIYFFDYGNTESWQAEHLFELPSELHNNPPPLARRIRLQKETAGDLEFGMAVSLSWDMDAEIYSLTRDPTDPRSTANHDATASLSGQIVNVVAALGDSNYAVILEENRIVYKYINGQINDNVGQLSKPKKIAINEMCLAIYEDENWHRAKIVNLTPLTVCFLDFANEMKCSFAQIKAMPSDLARIPPLAFKIRTEDYIELEEGSEVKITKIEEIDHNYWKVATVKDRKESDRKRVEIVSDPKHIGIQIKKKPKSSSNSIMASLSKDTTPAIDENVTFKRRTQPDYETWNRNDDPKTSHNVVRERFGKQREGTSKDVVPPGPNIVNPYDENSLVLTALSNKPKHYPTNVNTLTNGVEHLALADPIRNSTFDDINVPISDHLLDVLRVGDHCVLIIYDTFNDFEYTGMLLCKRLQCLVDILDHMSKSAESTESYSAKRGDLVMTHVEGINTWQRAYVVHEPSNVDPFYQVILFDIGKMYKTDQVFRLSEEFRRAPQLSVRINVTRFQQVPDEVARLEVVPMNVDLIEGDTYQHDKSIYLASLTRITEDGFEAKFKSQFCKDSISHSVKLSKWRPNREEVGVKPVPLMSGDLVKIGYICQTDQCYVVPIDDPINEQRNDFLSKVALHCREAQSIQGELKLKDIVGVPYMKSYFRAQIIERKMDSYLVHILDLGNEVKVRKNEVKWLPDHLKFADCYAVCVQLHNVRCTDFNQMSEIFLKYVITHETEFTLEINESTRLIELIFNEEVEPLDMKKGSSFNLRLSQLLVPTWKVEALDFNTPFYMMQLKFEEWPIGEELSLAFVESIDEKSGFMINRYGETYAKLVRVNLDERLREYAEEVKDSYVPCKDELCIAKFEGQWCRAVCIYAEPGKDLNLMYIDIGYQRQVRHTDIRRMHADFLKHPAAALFCDVKNYLDCKSLHDLQGKVLKKCKVLSKLEDGGYSIHVANLSAYA